MVFLQGNDPRQSLLTALEYSSQFKFPLTSNELWLWQPGTTFPESAFSFWPHQSEGYFFLPGKKNSISLRKKKTFISEKKVDRAQKIVSLLKRIPTIKAIYITGSVAVSNSSTQDDIDLMIVTSSNSVWLTRMIVVLILSLLSIRRPSGLDEHSSALVSDKICDNLYLDEGFLSISHNPQNFQRNFYLAHEILQAKPVWSKNNIPFKFIESNSWSKQYYPVIYNQLNKKFKLPYKANYCSVHSSSLLFIANLFFFLVQYLYMRPRFTRESVGLNYAFFHPRQSGI